jgi:hypothetical protein
VLVVLSQETIRAISISALARRFAWIFVGARDRDFLQIYLVQMAELVGIAQEMEIAMARVLCDLDR